MKLSRALLERRDLTKKIARVKEEIQASLVTPEHQAVNEAAINLKFGHLNELMENLHHINLVIDRANAEHLTADLNMLRILDSKIDFYKACRKALVSDNDMRYYSRSEVKDVKNISVNTINNKLEELEEERKNLDASIQEKNWTIEVDI